MDQELLMSSYYVQNRIPNHHPRFGIKMKKYQFGKAFGVSFELFPYLSSTNRFSIIVELGKYAFVIGWHAVNIEDEDSKIII